MRKQLSGTAACEHNVPATVQPEPRRRSAGAVIRKGLHADRAASFDYYLGGKASLDDFNPSLSKRTTKRLLDVKASGVSARVQHTPRPMRAFEAERQLAALSIERNIKVEQVPDSRGRLVCQYLYGASITQPAPGCDRILEMKGRTINR